MAGRPPPSFKTDVNRQKTKKWTDAKSYSYEGDDWGGYDEFGEYGNYDQPSSSSRSASATGFRQPGQALPPVNTNLPSQNPPSAPMYLRGRMNSFEVGDERRNFSAGSGPPPSGMLQPQPQAASSRSVSQPLYGNAYDQQPSDRSSASFPPRQSSLTFPSQDGEPSDQPLTNMPASAEAAPAPADTQQPPSKPFTFIRPADIYKRMQEEKEKERRSMDSNRTSFDSTDRSRKEVQSSLASPVSRARESSGSPAGMRGSLQTVPERKSEYGFDGVSIPDHSPPTEEPTSVPSTVLSAEQNRESLSSLGSQPKSQLDPAPTVSSSSAATSTPFLPQFGNLSGFDNDFWNISSTSTSNEPQGVKPTTTLDTSTPHDDRPSPGFRSAVEHAFGPNEQVKSAAGLSGPGSQRSVAGSELSGTNSTAGISPIMSPVPSAATATRQAPEQAEVVAPAPIMEESQESIPNQGRPTSSSTLKAPVTAVEAESQGNPSQKYPDTRNLALQTETSNANASTAEYTETSPNASSVYTQTPTSGILGDLSRGFSATGPTSEGTLPPEPPAVQTIHGEPVSATGSGRFSPTKGRVKDLASQYDVIHRTRSNSIQSSASERSRQDSVGAQTPGGTNLDGTSEEPVYSFESSAQLHPDTSKSDGIGAAEDGDESSITHTPDDVHHRSTQATPISEPIESSERNVDTPTDTSHHLVGAISNANPGPETEEPSAIAVPELRVSQARSSSDSGHIHENDASINPDDITSPPPLRQAASPTIGQTLPIEESSALSSSPDPSADELESDRLREDIVNSLNRTSQGPGTLQPQDLASRSPIMAPPSPRTDDTRESTAIPREYDSYWSSSGHFGRYPGTVTVTDYDRATPASSAAVVSPQDPKSQENQARQDIQVQQPTPEPAAPAQPTLKKRFSWEEEEDEEEDYAATSPVQPYEEPQSPPETQDFHSTQPSPIVGIRTSDRDIVSPLGESMPVSPATDEARTSYAIPEITFGDSADEGQAAKGLTLSDPSARDADVRPSLSEDEEVETADDYARYDEDEARDSFGRSSDEKREYVMAEEKTLPAPPSSNIPLEKLPGFRDIMSMKQTGQRIQTYNQTRDGFAGIQTGLTDWLTYMVTAHPEHAKPPPEASAKSTGPASALASSVRSKILTTASSQPYYQQYLNAPGALPPATSSPVNSGPAPVQAEASNKYRTSSGAPPTPGEKLLHSAGILGGKATIGAKGLLAKGKNKMKGGSSDKGKSSSSKFSSLRGLQPDKPIDKTSSERNLAPSFPPPPEKPLPSLNENNPTIAKAPEPEPIPVANQPPIYSSKDNPQLNGFPAGDGRSRGNLPEVSSPSSGQNNDARLLEVGNVNIMAVESSTTPQSEIDEPGFSMSGNRSLAMLSKQVPRTSTEGSIQPENPSTSAVAPGSEGAEFDQDGADLDLPPGVLEAVVRASMDSYRTAPDDSAYRDQLEVTNGSKFGSEFGMYGAEEVPFNASSNLESRAIEQTTNEAEPDEVLVKSQSQTSRLLETGEVFPDLKNVDSSQPNQNDKEDESFHETSLSDEYAFLKEIDAEFAPRTSTERAVRDPNALLATDDRSKPKPTNLYDSKELMSAHPVGQDSKEYSVAGREIHPAMRDQSGIGMSSSMKESEPTSRPGPAVDPQSLPPSVRKQYLAQSNEDDSNSTVTPDGHASSTSLSQHNQSFDTARSQESLVSSAHTDGEKNREASSWEKFRARARGASAGAGDAQVGPSPLRSMLTRTEDQEETPKQEFSGTTQKTGSSPWRRLRARSRGPSLGEPDAPSGFRPKDAQYAEGATNGNTAQEEPKSPFRMFRPRSRGKSLETADAAPESAAQAERTERPKSPFRHIRARSRGKSLETPDEPFATPSQAPGPTGNVVESNQPQEQSKSAFRMFRPRSRGKSLETANEPNNTTGKGLGTFDGGERSDSQGFHVYRETTRVGSLDLPGVPNTSTQSENTATEQRGSTSDLPTEQNMSAWQKIKAKGRRPSVEQSNGQDVSTPQFPPASSTATPMLPEAIPVENRRMSGNEGKEIVEERSAPGPSTNQPTSPNAIAQPRPEPQYFAPLSQFSMPPEQAPTPPPQSSTPPPRYSIQAPPVTSPARSPMPNFRSPMSPVQTPSLEPQSPMYPARSSSQVPRGPISPQQDSMASPPQPSVQPTQESMNPSQAPMASQATNRAVYNSADQTSRGMMDGPRSFNPALQAPRPVNPATYSGYGSGPRDIADNSRRFNPNSNPVPYNANLSMTRNMMTESPRQFNRTSSLPTPVVGDGNTSQQFDDFGMPIEEQEPRASRTKRNSILADRIIDSSPQSQRSENKRRSWFGALFSGSNPSSAAKERSKPNNRLSKTERRATEPVAASAENTEQWVQNQQQTTRDPPLSQRPSQEQFMTSQRTSRENSMSSQRSSMEPPSVSQRPSREYAVSRRTSREPVMAQPATIDENSDQLIEAPAGAGPYPRFSHKHYLQTHGVLPARPMSTGQSFPLNLSPDVRASLIQPRVDSPTEAPTPPKASEQPKPPREPRNTLRRRGGPPRSGNNRTTPGPASSVESSRNNSFSTTPLPQPPQLARDPPQQPLNLANQSQAQARSWTPPVGSAPPTTQESWDPSTNLRVVRPYMPPNPYRIPLD